MTAVTIELQDDLYQCVKQAADARGLPVEQEIVQRVEESVADANGHSLAAARSRMETLFQTVHGFRMTSKISREELHERGRVR